MATNTMATPATDYVQPNNAGLNSEPEAVGRRIAKLLDATASLINPWIATGQIENDCRQFRTALINSLEASGWTVKLGAHDRFIVRPLKGKDF